MGRSGSLARRTRSNQVEPMLTLQALLASGTRLDAGRSHRVAVTGLAQRVAEIFQV
jgi:hypothetical protein